MDESGVDHRLYREKGRAPRGQRLYEKVSGSRRKRTSIIAASQGNKLVAPFVFEGACNAGVVDAYFEQVLLPQLPRGSVLVLDNASFHHGKNTERLAREAGVELLFLPAYSPDLNPIEHIWAAFKTALRKVLPTCDDPFLCVGDMSLRFC